MSSSYSSLRRLAFPITLVLGFALISTQPSFALQKYKDQAVDLYGLTGSRLDTCNLCHIGGGGSPRNHYGWAFEETDRSADAMESLEELDSDQDGVSNLIEILAGTFPGNENDTPDDLQILLATRHTGWTPLTDDEQAYVWSLIKPDHDKLEWSSPAAVKLAVESLDGLREGELSDPEDIELAQIAGGEVLAFHRYGAGTDIAAIGLVRGPDGAITSATLLAPWHPSEDLNVLALSCIGKTSGDEWSASGLLGIEKAPPHVDALIRTIYQTLKAMDSAVPPRT